MTDINMYSNQPIFTTGVASKITGVKPKTIINYDNSDLLDVERSEKNRRLFSKKDLYNVLLIRYLIEKKNLTFEAVRFFLDLNDKLMDEDIDLVDYIIPEKKQKEIESVLNI
jgi:DNA-binding transcriptional MerR regulator